MTFRPVPDLSLAAARLKSIFPPEALGTTPSNPSAAKSVVAMIYMGAVVPDEGDPVPEYKWTRPSAVTNMSAGVLLHTSNDERRAWTDAVLTRVQRAIDLLSSWGHNHSPWYAGNSREGPRDEVWPEWVIHNAMRKRAGVKTTSSEPRWAITASFAGLFDPSVSGEELEEAIEQWQHTHMSPGAKLKAMQANAQARGKYETHVVLPNGTIRGLEPGLASDILKGVIEVWAPARLTTPAVVAISEPGTKLAPIDAAQMAKIGLSINVSGVLADAIIADLGTTPVAFWVIEAVATDGEINDHRKAALLDWAYGQNIKTDDCRFLSAFASRNAGPAKKRLKDIASGSYCWFLSEPEHELSWDKISKS